MCTNYAAARHDKLFKHYGIEPPDSPWRDDIYKDYPAPIIRRIDGALRADVATFGIVPRKHIPEGVKVFDTMNARAEINRIGDVTAEIGPREERRISNAERHSRGGITDEFTVLAVPIDQHRNDRQDYRPSVG